jgi:hypothetical protein
MKQTYVEGRDDQFRDMMQALEALEAKYKGVRGELLAKVRGELTKLKPSPSPAATLKVVPPAAPVDSHEPACRVCAREMKRNGTDGRLVCQNGHTR